MELSSPKPPDVHDDSTAEDESEATESRLYFLHAAKNPIPCSLLPSAARSNQASRESTLLSDVVLVPSSPPIALPIPPLRIRQGTALQLPSVKEPERRSRRARSPLAGGMRCGGKNLKQPGRRRRAEVVEKVVRHHYLQQHHCKRHRLVLRSPLSVLTGVDQIRKVKVPGTGQKPTPSTKSQKSTRRPIAKISPQAASAEL